MSLYILPFILQGLFMIVDEFYFHEKRSLPKWERIGHPLDTMTTLLALSIPVFFKYDSFNLTIYIIAAIFSCVFITKDEFIHSDYCSQMEHWLHSVLFLLHPITFAAAYLIWSQEKSLLFIQFQICLIFVFMLYQIFRWSGPWQRLQR